MTKKNLSMLVFTSVWTIMTYAQGADQKLSTFRLTKGSGSYITQSSKLDSKHEESDEFKVVFTDPRMRTSKAGHTTAGFVEITNMTNQDLQIVKVTCNAARITEMHISIEENHIHKMRPVSYISIDKGETTLLQPGGLHIMLVDLKKTLVVGKKVDITLTFNNGHKTTVPFIVKDICKHCQ